jgi:hypothetical protein
MAAAVAVVLCAAVFLRLGVSGLANLNDARSNHSLVIMPPALAKLGPSQYVWRTMGAVRYRMPIFHGYGRCFATELPCAPDPMQANFKTIRRLRLYNNTDLSGGFIEDDPVQDK